MDPRMLKNIGLAAMMGIALGTTTYFSLKRKEKPLPTALLTGGVTAFLSWLMYRAGYAGGKVDALGGSMGRMGLYIPAPTVKKYPAFAGTQYYA